MGQWNERTTRVWPARGTERRWMGATTVDCVAEAVDAALQDLSPREEQVVRWRFGLGHRAKDVSAIAVRFHVTPASVRRIEEQALQKLRALAMDFGAGCGVTQHGSTAPANRRARLRTNRLTSLPRSRRSAQ